MSCHKCHIVTAAYHMTSHDGSHDRHGKEVHRPCSSCISSIEKSNGNSIEFSLSNSEQRDSWLNSGHWTLDADTEEIHCIYLVLIGSLE